jgi:hypothetical protein
MARNQPPFTPEQARALSRAAPKGQGYKAGTAGPTKYGRGGASKMFKPGQRTHQTGPESGKHYK